MNPFAKKHALAWDPPGENMGVKPPEGPWSAAEGCLRRYVGRLDHPQGELLVTQSLCRAAARSGGDALLHPVKTVLEELHGLLASRDGNLAAAAAEASLAWRLRRWTAGESVLRAAPPIRLGHMVPELFSAAGSARLDDAPGQLFGPPPALPGPALALPGPDLAGS